MQFNSILWIECARFLVEHISCNFEGKIFKQLTDNKKRTINIDKPTYNDRFLEKNSHLYSCKDDDCRLIDW